MPSVEQIRLLISSIANPQILRKSDEGLTRDGSRESFSALIELGLSRGPFLDKIYTLYSCGVDDHQSQVFDLRQLLSMLIYRDWYKPGITVSRNNGMSSGRVCCASAKDKQILLESFARIIDEIDRLDIDATNFRNELLKRGVSDLLLSTLSDSDLYFGLCQHFPVIICVDTPFLG